jgi:hypothetical protein
LRANDRCPEAFRLKRSQLTSTGMYGTVFGYVIEKDNGKPEGGDGTVACFSNCGKYKFPLEPQLDPDLNCKSPTTLLHVIITRHFAPLRGSYTARVVTRMPTAPNTV